LGRLPGILFFTSPQPNASRIEAPAASQQTAADVLGSSRVQAGQQLQDRCHLRAGQLALEQFGDASAAIIVSSRSTPGPDGRMLATHGNGCVVPWDLMKLLWPVHKLWSLPLRKSVR
jgi:hypothetical protein